jgi:hypothetical protein
VDLCSRLGAYEVTALPGRGARLRLVWSEADEVVDVDGDGEVIDLDALAAETPPALALVADYHITRVPARRLAAG